MGWLGRRLVGIGRRTPRDGGGFLARLARARAGNTLAIMAAALIPVLALTGSAVDTARLYVVKVRLQQACDAGVLAGRKTMDTSNSAPAPPTLDANAVTQAKTFFANNFISGYMGTPTYTPTTTPYPFTATKTTDYQVAGTASITVPMTIMKMLPFGVSAQTLTVTCQARFDTADADVMFVLDTTGSMACLTSDDQGTCDNYAASASNVVKNADGNYSVTEKSNSRISGLRSAVLSFYDTLTNNALNQPTHFRFGFVPYSATVNVGYLLPKSYLATSWPYQSRTYTGYSNNGSASTTTTTSTTSAACTAKAGLAPWTTNVATGTSGSAVGSYTSTVTTVTSWTPANGGTCITSVQPVIANFQYQQRTLDVSSYTGGTPVTNPTRLDNSKSTWNGCIEERGGTTTNTTFDPANPPLDLDVDTAPSSSIANSYWAPMWVEAEYARQNNGETVTDYRDQLTRYQFGGYFGTYQLAHYFNEIPCPKQASRLSSMQLASMDTASIASMRSQITDYLSASNGFRPYGVTYHDYGIVWGTRLLSPNGIFASDTAAWTGHNPPNRYIIFLTDGTMETDLYGYTSHGIDQFDNRVGANGNSANLNNIHNNRFSTACTIAKNHNITIFVIGYAQTLTTQLQNCASPNKFYYASDSAALSTAFSNIAKQVAMLRISQ